MPHIIGTAGHIDHGKTALVKALTGVDTDRLPDEKRRGITIDLGFAEMTVGDAHFDFVDVPGHERFVRNMLAGASGIDLVLLVVAADEGVMPQTREHFDICRLLNIEGGLIALTKADLVDEETLELAKLDVSELVAGSFLEQAPCIAVSSRSRHGVEQLKRALVQAVMGLKVREDIHSVRLPIDRSFSVKGFGTVVTGTLASGEITPETSVELMPGGRAVRIRGLQAHGSPTNLARSGQRVAVNLAGVDHHDVQRGMTLASARTLESTQIIDALVEVLASAPVGLRSRQRVRVHLGTAEILARVQVLSDEMIQISGGQMSLVQLRLETPTVAVPGQRFIIRTYSPQVTLAGGIVIDNLATRHRRKDIVRVREKLLARRNALNDPIRTISVIVDQKGRHGITPLDLQFASAFADEVLEISIEQNLASGEIVDAEGLYISGHFLSEIEIELVEILARFHRQHPLETGITRQALMAGPLRFTQPNVGVTAIKRLRDRGDLIIENDLIRLSSHSLQMSPEEASFAEAILAQLEHAALEVPRIADALSAARHTLTVDRADKLLRRLVDAGRIVKVTDEFYFASIVMDRTIDELRTSGNRSIDVAGFKALTGVSRKYAIPLLEYFDRIHVTARVGDKRVIL